MQRIVRRIIDVLLRLQFFYRHPMLQQFKWYWRVE
jgi:hypothetical protein